MLCDEKIPTVSLIFPLKHMIEQSMAPDEHDSSTVANTKKAILKNITDRYSGAAFDYLLESTAMDPRFRSLPQLDHNQREAVFQRLQDKARVLQQNQVCCFVNMYLLLNFTHFQCFSELY